MKFKARYALRIEDHIKSLGGLNSRPLVGGFLSANYKKLNKANYPMEAKIEKSLLKIGLSNFSRNYPLLNRWFGDFVFHEILLVIEYDGQHHLEAKQKIKDAYKDECLTKFGFTVLRFNKSIHYESFIEFIKQEHDKMLLNPPSKMKVDRVFGFSLTRYVGRHKKKKRKLKKNYAFSNGLRSGVTTKTRKERIREEIKQALRQTPSVIMRIEPLKSLHPKKAPKLKKTPVEKPKRYILRKNRLLY